VADRLIVDLGADRLVSVSSQLEGEDFPSRVAEPFELAWPLDSDALKELRWYLEDYLRAPYGVYAERGANVQGALREWGEEAFDSVLGRAEVRDVYTGIRERPGAPTEVVFQSSSPALLGLPWELLRDPSRPTPVVLDGVGLMRSIPAARLGETFAANGDTLRVLMVISRPDGPRDVGFRMIARPLLERLEAVRGKVELVVLRPPTLEALEDALAQGLEENRPFQVVHFDGHGVLSGRRSTLADLGERVTLEAADGEGVLVFEKDGGGSDEISAVKVAQVLKAGQVPLVVLNACQSGAVGKELEAAVATRLLQEGISSVVAMAYTVYAVAAAEFMTAFYERLFAGDGVTQAVSAGRLRLHQHDRRPSPRGEMALADWVVPVHYRRREVQFPYLRTERPADAPTLDEQLDRELEQTGREDSDLEAVGSFVGRDNMFYELEAAAREGHVVVLHGPGGTGKTELAKAFGRWWRDTGGVEQPDWVIFHSFEPGVASFGLDGVITAVGLRVHGADFAQLDAPKRRKAVEKLLMTRRLLLIWDNFESVLTMPDPAQATPPLEEAEREELRGFVRLLATKGRSSLIITSRTEETWLGELRRVALGGLNADETNQYAEQILKGVPAALPGRARPAFVDLLKWLDGHPLSMRLILPHLATTEPEALLASLQGISELPVAGDDHGRTTSLTASVTYSFRHLDTTARQLLVAVCLFQGVVDADVLGLLSGVQGVPARFSGISKERWAEVLNGAAAVGLLTKLGAGMYRIHPALPAVLAALWRSEEPDDYQNQRTSTTRALLSAYASFGAWLLNQIQTGQAGFAFFLIDLQRRTLGHLLGLALDNELWGQAQAIAQPLDDYFDARGEYEEARAWVDRACLTLEGPDGTPPPLESPAGALWIYFVSAQASREVTSHNLDSAERTYRAIQETLERQSESPTRQSMLAGIYHQLGIVEQERGRMDEAEQLYLKSLEISEQLGDRPGMARSYHHLGRAEEERGQMDKAEQWYLKSLEIDEQVGDRPGIASSYHQLGIVEQVRGRMDEAEQWYLKSLEISEQLGDRPGMARSYHHLGIVAQKRQQMDVAEQWYLKSLEIEEQLGDQPGMARSYGQLGLLAEAKGQDLEALQWTIRCVALFDEFPHRATGPGPRHLARLTAQLGIESLERCWQQVTDKPLPQPVHEFVSSFPR
jgi:tetratricopeptide (TPR) repeat protein